VLIDKTLTERLTKLTFKGSLIISYIPIISKSLCGYEVNMELHHTLDDDDDV